MSEFFNEVGMDTMVAVMVFVIILQSAGCAILLSLLREEKAKNLYLRGELEDALNENPCGNCIYKEKALGKIFVPQTGEIYEIPNGPCRNCEKRIGVDGCLLEFKYAFDKEDFRPEKCENVVRCVRGDLHEN